MNVYCTIVARNYLHHARALARSFRSVHSDDSFFCLVTDPTPGQGWSDPALDADPLSKILSAEDLGISPELLSGMAFAFDVVEFATALKPFVLQHLLELAGPDGVATYLDPDTFVYAPVPHAGTPDAAILLTPHRLTPPPLDDQDIQESLLLSVGSFNLGYISVTRAALPMLDWWAQRLTVDSVIAPAESLFTDQKWMDLAPIYFPVEQLRDPGVNLAWWNLDERHVARAADGVTVNGLPLRLAHFSGFRKGKPSLPMRQAPGPEGEQSRSLFEELARTYTETVESERRPADADGDYRFATYTSGRPISRYERRRYREQFRQAVVAGQSVPPAPWGLVHSAPERAKLKAFESIDKASGHAFSWEAGERIVRRRAQRIRRRVQRTKG